MSFPLAHAVRCCRRRAGSRNFVFPTARLFFLFAILSLSIGLASQGGPAAQTRASDFENPAIEKRVESILRTMTLDEKVGQLVQYSAGQPTGPGTGRTDYEDMIARGQIGSLFNVVDPHQINQYQRIAMEKARLHIPILFGLDVIHGFKTEFPIPLGLASTWEPSIVERVSRVAASEAAAYGIRWTFSPMVDIARDARWGRMSEGAGEDPFLGSAMAAAYVRGYQGTHLNAPDSLLACAKHYVGYGAAEGGRDYNTTEISEHTLREIYLPPFQAAVNARVGSVMSAFNSLDGVPASANPFTLRELLRKEWQFHGLVVSDWNAIGELIPHGIANDEISAARKAFLSGIDMDMVSSLYHDHLKQLVGNGQISLAQVDDSVRHVLRVKLALGLFEQSYVDEAAAPKVLYRPESIAAAQLAAEHSFVLLKNEKQADGSPVLPLGNDAKKIAVIGPLALDPSYPDGAPEGTGPRVSLVAALANRIGEASVSHFKGVSVLGGSDAGIAAAVAGAQKADLVILTLGERPDMSGEAASRAHLGLPGRQEELLEAIVRTGKPVVLILFSGRPLTVPWAFEHVPAVVAAWLPGIASGPALTRALFGDVNPSGKLVVSWPRSVGQEPLYYNALNTGRPPGNIDLSHPPENIDARYISRYIDENNTPQFPFGYGLSYTTFSYSTTRISTEHLNASQLNRGLGSSSVPAMVAEADVTNTGSRQGDEVVQLYLALTGTSTAQPVRSLKGFQKISLLPGETKHVKFELRPADFAIRNDRNQFAAEPSRLSVWISPDSAHGTAGSAEILP
jgi:beta-glucosidase